MKRIIPFIFLLLFLAIPLVGAADSGYSIRSFSSQIDVASDGTYLIHESISMDFHKALHGFYRVIPVEYRFNDPARQDIRVRVSGIKASEKYQSSIESGYLVLKVGDPDRTVTGKQDYSISYRYNIGNDRNEGYDAFYFNLIGEDWQVPIEIYEFTITFPHPINEEKIWFYRGYYESISSDGVWWQLSQDRQTITGYTDTLMPGEAVTLQVEMPDGYFELQPDYQKIVSKFNFWVALCAVCLAIFLWIRFGRDEDLVVVTQFDPPEGMSPMDVGYIIDETLDPRDITSMIFYWADKGNLSIIEDDGKFSFVRGKDPVGASPYEQRLYNAFFKNATNGVVKTSDLQGKFFTEYQKMGPLVSRYYSGARALSSPKSRNIAVLSGLLILIPALGYAIALTANAFGPATFIAALFAIAVGLLFAVMTHLIMRIWHIRKPISKVLWFMVMILIGLIACGILSIPGFIAWNDYDVSIIEAVKAVFTIAPISFFAIITRKRSEFGKKSIEAVLGYREFIDKVEVDKLKRMIDEDPEYYYHVLSYAIVLGLEKKWAKKFDNITLEPPNWYMGRYDLWNAMFISSMLSRCNTALVSSMVTMPKSSPGGRFGGSSFGGGGFSGGGFGGGGGGAW